MSAPAWAMAAADAFDPPPPRPEIASPVAFAEKYGRGQFRRFRHVEVIEQALLDTVETGGRLILSASVRHGKSELASKWFPAWYLGTHPHGRVILAGHEADFAARWGRAARDILTEFGPSVFGVSVSRRSEAANRWDLERPHTAGMLTVGVGGSPIGRGASLCIAAGTLIATPQGPVEIGVLANRGGTVWGYDHDAGRPVVTRITAATESVSSELVEVEFRSGRRLRCTPDHPIYVHARGYVHAGRLRPDDTVSVLGDAGVPPLRDDVRASTQGHREDTAPRRNALLLASVLEPAQGWTQADPPQDGDGLVRSLPERGGRRWLGVRQEDWTRSDGVLLRAVLRGRVPKGQVSRSRRRDPHLPELRGLVRAAPQRVRSRSTEGRDQLLLEAVRRPAPGSATARTPEAPGDGDSDVLRMRAATGPAGMGTREAHQQGTGALLLRPDVRPPGSAGDPALRALRSADREEDEEVLPSLPEGRQERTPRPTRHHVSRVRHEVPSEVLSADVLLQEMRQPSALASHGGQGQLALPGRNQLRRVVPSDAPADPRTGRRLRRVWDHTQAPRPPHRHEPEEQRPGEPDHAVLEAPRDPPQVESDAVAVVRRVRPGRHLVYDLEVEGTHNLFAGEVLVHNCVVDDPIKSYKDAMSPLIRQRVIEWWTGTMASRIEPGGAVVLIMARWHESDLAGFLLREDPENWRELRLPAVCDDPGSDPLGRDAGEALWPERWPIEALEARRREVSLALGEAVWLAQYQQRPMPPGGGMFPERQWRFMGAHEVPDGLSWVRAWDLAASKDSGDWTVGARMARLPDGRFVIDGVVRGQWDSWRVRDELVGTARRDPERTSIDLPQDPGQAGKAQAQQLIALLPGYNVKAAPVTGSKEVRAAGYAAQQQAGNVVLVEGPWNGAWVAEHASFPRGSHDDQVDCGAGAFNALVGESKPAVRWM